RMRSSAWAAPGAARSQASSAANASQPAQRPGSNAETSLRGAAMIPSGAAAPHARRIPRVPRIHLPSGLRMENFDYLAPRSLDEAYAHLGNGRTSLMLAGGTDVIIQLREG